MIKYTYKYITTYALGIVILTVGYYLMFPVQDLWFLAFFMIPLLIVLWRFVNFIEVTDDYIVLTSFLRKRRFYFSEIEKIRIVRDNSLHNGTIGLTIYMEGRKCTVMFGNLRHDQVEPIQHWIGHKAKVEIL